MKAASGFAIACLTFLFSGCVTGDEISSYVVNPDDSISFSIYRLNLTSDQTGEKAKEELAQYIQNLEGKKGNLFRDLMKGKAKEVRVTVLRSASPASALITGRIPSLEDLAAYGSHEDEDSSFVCKAISTEHTRGYLCEITRKPSKEKAQAERTPTEPAESRADSFEEIRFALSEGTITKAEGFMVAHNKRSALLDLDRLMNLWNSRAPKITIALEWQVE